MRAVIYPAFFRHVDTGGYSVDFPDLPGCATAGTTIEDAVSAAREALSLHLYGMAEDGDQIPGASDPSSIPAEEGAFITIIEGRPDMVGDAIKNRSVKKTLTIPYWLNEEAERHKDNFSQVLQEALRQRIGV